MSSLAELPQVVGFFSYSREDDEDSGGALSQLRTRIQRELRSQLGRTRSEFRLWQDASAISFGKLWESEIRSAIAESVFFIPIVTPTAVRSGHCKLEFDSFLEREAALGRSDLVFPIYYIEVPGLTDERRWRQDPVLSIIARRQYIDWQKLRHVDVSSSEVGLAIERFCANIAKALRQPWTGPSESKATVTISADAVVASAPSQSRRTGQSSTESASAEQSASTVAAQVVGLAESATAGTVDPRIDRVMGAIRTTAAEIGRAASSPPVPENDPQSDAQTSRSKPSVVDAASSMEKQADERGRKIISGALVLTGIVELGAFSLFLNSQGFPPFPGAGSNAITFLFFLLDAATAVLGIVTYQQWRYASRLGVFVSALGLINGLMWLIRVFTPPPPLELPYSIATAIYVIGLVYFVREWWREAKR